MIHGLTLMTTISNTFNIFDMILLWHKLIPLSFYGNNFLLPTIFRLHCKNNAKIAKYFFFTNEIHAIKDEYSTLKNINDQFWSKN